jgi:hypothetical protein
MKPLKEADVLRVMREEWQAKVKSLAEQVDVVMNSRVEKKSDVPVLSPELKVMHKTSGIRYTIDSVGPRDAILRTPEGDTFLVDKGTFEHEYELD